MIRAPEKKDAKLDDPEIVTPGLAMPLEEQYITTYASWISVVDVGQMADVDISAISGPTCSFGMPQPMVELVDSSSGVNLQENITLVSGTSSKSFLSGTVNSIAAMLKSLGARIVAPRYSTSVSTKGVLKQDRIEEESSRISLTHMIR